MLLLLKSKDVLYQVSKKPAWYRINKNKGIDSKTYKNTLNYTLKLMPQFLSTAVRLRLKIKILLSNLVLTLYKAGLPRGIQDRHIQFTLSAIIYSIDKFNAKVNISG